MTAHAVEPLTNWRGVLKRFNFGNGVVVRKRPPRFRLKYGSLISPSRADVSWDALESRRARPHRSLPSHAQGSAADLLARS